MIVKGYSDVGDGFSAGVIVGLAVTLQYIALGPRGAEAALPMLRLAPIAVVTGLLLALAAGFFPIVYGGAIFTHFPPAGVHPIRIGTLELITAVVLDLGVFLLVAGVLVVLVRQLTAPETEAAE